MADFVEPLAAICALCAVFFDSASRCCAVSVACNTSGWFSVSTDWIASASGEAAADFHRRKHLALGDQPEMGPVARSTTTLRQKVGALANAVFQSRFHVRPPTSEEPEA